MRRYGSCKPGHGIPQADVGTHRQNAQRQCVERVDPIHSHLLLCNGIMSLWHYVQHRLERYNGWYARYGSDNTHVSILRPVIRAPCSTEKPYRYKIGMLYPTNNLVAYLVGVKRILLCNTNRKQCLARESSLQWLRSSVSQKYFGQTLLPLPSPF